MSEQRSVSTAPAPKRVPRSLGPDDLVLSHFTLPRHHPIEERVEAAAAAGYAAIGLYIGDYERLKGEGFAGAWLDELLDRHGMIVADIEVVRGWALRGEPYERCLAMEASAWEMADRWGCRYLQAIGPYDGTIADAGDAFGALCDRAGEHGLVVGLEFLPFTNVVDAADGMRIVEQADRENGGLCMDIWHHSRGANDMAMVRAVPGTKIMGIQMNDGPRVPTIDNYYEDCLRFRVAPGDGEMEAVEFVRALIDSGTTAPWSIEVCNVEAWENAPVEHVQRCADGMRSVLDRARTTAAN